MISMATYVETILNVLLHSCTFLACLSLYLTRTIFTTIDDHLPAFPPSQSAFPRSQSALLHNLPSLTICPYYLHPDSCHSLVPISSLFWQLVVMSDYTRLYRCSASPIICLETDNIIAGSNFTISWPSAFFTTAATPAVYIALYNGFIHSAVLSQCSPRINGTLARPVQQWQANYYYVDEGVAHMQLNISVDLIEPILSTDPLALFFFQVTSLDQRSCLMGPLEQPNWSISLPQAAKSTQSAGTSSLPSPISTNTSSQNNSTIDTSSNNQPNLPVILSVSLSSLFLAIVVFIAVILHSRRHRRQMISTDSFDKSKLLSLSSSPSSEPVKTFIPISTHPITNNPNGNEMSIAIHEVTITTPDQSVLVPETTNIFSSPSVSHSFVLSYPNMPYDTLEHSDSMGSMSRASAQSGLLPGDAKLIADTFRKELGDMAFEHMSDAGSNASLHHIEDHTTYPYPSNFWTM